MKVGFLDSTHEVIQSKFNEAGWNCIDLKGSNEKEIIARYSDLEGIILRSRLRMDATFLSHFPSLKFIGRPGAGLENIDLDYCDANDIWVFRSPEGNCDAVGEHAIGMILSLLNNLRRADLEVREMIWKREENRGYELKGKTIGLIGYGVMGKAMAKKLSGFEVETLAYDKYLNDYTDDFVQEATLNEIFEKADILSIHTPLTEETIGMYNLDFFNQFKKSIIVVNTARGQSLILKDLLQSLETNKIAGACLDVLEVESSSFTELDTSKYPELTQLIKDQRIIFSPHIAGWTHEAKFKMGDILASKILKEFNPS